MTEVCTCVCVTAVELGLFSANLSKHSILIYSVQVASCSWKVHQVPVAKVCSS